MRGGCFCGNETGFFIKIALHGTTSPIFLYKLSQYQISQMIIMKYLRQSVKTNVLILLLIGSYLLPCQNASSKPKATTEVLIQNPRYLLLGDDCSQIYLQRRLEVVTTLWNSSHLLRSCRTYQDTFNKQQRIVRS